ncbi:MAG: hydroxymethylpyrimidine/phosphomethylpyrimidine kinase [Methylomonas sp.]|jgi:hydroxymethylpyrimidine/phosphomethylpyrimidine kinase
MSSRPPIVLCFSGHDPSGGAGIQADIETIASLQCHCCNVITALTEQNSRTVKKIIPQKPEHIRQQAETLLADFNIAAIKIGLIGHIDTLMVIQEILRMCPEKPVVLDPVLAAGSGDSMAGEEVKKALVELLLPHTQVLTPNSLEARQLAGKSNLAECGRFLQAKGADFVLITGTHETSEQVENRLFMPDGETETFYWERLPESYHGSGCTLASAIAALLAQGLDTFTAVSEAQDYTWQTLVNAYQPGTGQYNPRRLFWNEQ